MKTYYIDFTINTLLLPLFKLVMVPFTLVNIMVDISRRKGDWVVNTEEPLMLEYAHKSTDLIKIKIET